jgi:hypothetical protein
LELVSLHPFDPEIAVRYVAALKGEREPDPGWQSWWSPALPAGLEGMASGSEEAANRISLGLAWALAGEHPSFVRMGFGLTAWEARVDRGVGMLMRPPSRLFIDAGLERGLLQVMPIRLDLQGGMMGGAYIPARLMDNLAELLDSRLERMARRLHDAENDPFPVIDLMSQAVNYARERGVGLYEAQDAVGSAAVQGMRLVEPSDKKRMDAEIRSRIQAAITPEKKPGFFSRFFHREEEGGQNGV